MRVAIIAPPRLLHLSEATNYHLGLVQLVKTDKVYREWHRTQAEAGHYVILDNGAAEGVVPPSPPILLRWAREIKANEVVAPDALCDFRGTLSLTEQFITEALIRQSFNGNFMLVPHGQDYTEWLYCFRRMRELWSGPRFIYGISRAVERRWDFPVRRSEIVMRLVRDGLLRPLEQVHLLGVGNSLVDIELLADSPYVRGIDTSLPIVAAQHGVDLSNLRGVDLQRLRYDPFESRISDELAHNNIAFFRGLCHDE